MKKQIIFTIVMFLILYGVASGQESNNDSTTLAGAIQSIFGKRQPKLNGLVQFWNTYQAKDGPVGDGRYNDAFRIRRFEVKISGKVNEEISYAGMVDFARAVSSTTEQGRVNVLQDLVIELSYVRPAVITVGQFKYPLTSEGLLSSSKLDFVERAEITRVFGDQRDLGVQIQGNLSPVSYAVGVFNGGGINKLDSNREKDIVGRIVYSPIDGFTLGGSGYVGRSGPDGGTPYHRAAGEIGCRVSFLKVSGEFLWAREGEVAPLLDMQGAYIALVYQLLHSTEIGGRYEYADDYLELAKGISRHRWTAGINYYLDEDDHAKVQLNYILTQTRSNSWNNYLYLNMQVTF